MKKKHYLIIGGILLVVLLYFISNIFVDPILDKKVNEQKLSLCRDVQCCYSYHNQISEEAYEGCVTKFNSQIVEERTIEVSYKIPSELDVVTGSAYGIESNQLSKLKNGQNVFTTELFQKTQKIDNREKYAEIYLNSILDLFSQSTGLNITELGEFQDYSYSQYTEYNLLTKEFVIPNDSIIGVYIISDNDSSNSLQGYYFMLLENEEQGREYLNEIYESVEFLEK